MEKAALAPPRLVSLPELDRIEQDIELNYEELLALEERIGTEEYTIGDEVGRLYYLKYVPEWLRMKSWCPICKTTAETSSSK
ncbi:hypothetical protein DY000_02036885 [Brassica cretica]|uniref:Uncharacterized protein n=1 Tax=Brassica cretica TaxID=69181 RepID=A0ABQ7BMG7_BRACR|nr:hypothetical protein DY000_02036885 [Brassica cretica]